MINSIYKYIFTINLVCVYAHVPPELFHCSTPNKMSSGNGNSFQILLEAEQKASELVNEARQCKKNNNNNYNNELI